MSNIIPISMEHNKYVLVNSNEYESLKSENIQLKIRINELENNELENNAEMLKQQISADNQTIEELRKENDFLKIKIRVS